MYHLYGIVLALELVAVFFYFIHYLKYASDGVGIPGLEGFADGLCFSCTGNGGRKKKDQRVFIHRCFY